MKYGEKLQQRSIPAWSAYNIDYDDVKSLIKKRTTPDNNKTSAAAAAKADDFQNELFDILDEQHRRIDLFVRSKAREIQHRLNDGKKRLRFLAARNPSREGRLSVRRLERYSRLESDVLKAGDEIRSLARFTGAQSTAFTKLLKKYKKWTGRADLDERFRQQVLDNPQSFIKYDIAPLLDDYSETLHNIRTLYESRLQQAASRRDDPEAPAFFSASPIARQLHETVTRYCKADFDTAIATVSLGEDGTYATYFVHPEMLVELQVLLVQHMNNFLLHSRSNSHVTVQSTDDVASRSASPSPHRQSNYFWLAADNADRFADEQRSLTSGEREYLPGSTPQCSKVCARWNTDDETEACIATRTGETHVQTTNLKRKHVQNVFDKTASFPPRKSSDSHLNTIEDLTAARSQIVKGDKVEPLYVMSSNRSRFVGINNSPKSVLLATLDTDIAIQPSQPGARDPRRSEFPFAVLIVRQEGLAYSNLISLLDQSHLVERVPGFSMEYHAVWQLHKPANMPAPSWMPTLSMDIRKLPPPALDHSDSAMTNGTSSAPNGSGSAGSMPGGGTGSTTAAETTASSTLVPSDLEQPPLRAFRKKRRQTYKQRSPLNPDQRYWSEYDHPEDEGNDNSNAYVIYINPNETTTFDRMLDAIASLFSKHKPTAADEESLLRHSTTPPGDESSSDDEGTHSPRKKKARGYGTLLQQARAPRTQGPSDKLPFLPQLTIACLIASAIIIIIGHVLAATGRHRFSREVNAGVIFSIVSSVLFNIAGIVILYTARNVQQLGVAVAVGTVLIESVAAGGLLAWIVG